MSTPTPDDWPPERIRELRERKGLTQQQFADRIGYKSRRSVSDIEARRADGEPRKRPSATVVLALESIESGDGACATVVRLWTDGDAGPMAESTRWRVRADWPEMAEALDGLSDDDA